MSASESPEEEGSVDECPACGGTSLRNPSGVPSTICIDCGVAIDTSATPQIPRTTQEDDPGMGPDSWGVYYSVTNSTEQQIANAFEELEGVGGALSLSTETRSQIGDVYALAAVENVTDGRRTRLTVAAAVCIGSREAESPRPTERVARAFDLEPKAVKRMLRVYQEELDRGFTEVSPASYVSFLCSDVICSSLVTE